MKRLVALLPVLVALQVGVPPALAWTWPADGPVLRPFVLGDDPYAAGQHRGIDVGAPAGAPVRAPAAGTVAFAGIVPGGGRTVTIETADGYSVTLVHLGSIEVARGAAVGEAAPVGVVGPSGEAEHPEPYVHLGIRRTSDEHGYVDPLAFLPARQGGGAVPGGEAPAEEPKEKKEKGKGKEQAGGDPSPAPTPPAHARVRAAAERAADAREREQRAAVRRLRARRPAGDEGRAGTRASRDGRAAARRSGGAQEAVPAAAAPGTAAVEPPSRGWLEPQAASPRSPSAGPAAGDGTPAGGLVAAVREAPGGVALAALSAIAACGLLAVRRRKLGDAAPADRPAAMLLDRVGGAAEDAELARTAQEDDLVLDRDLERVLLPEVEPLPDLDRNHDPAELVDVADDPRSLHPPPREQACRHRNPGPRSPRHGAGSRPTRVVRSVEASVPRGVRF